MIFNEANELAQVDLRNIQSCKDNKFKFIILRTLKIKTAC